MNLDVLQLYVVLMACFPVVLWAMLRKPGLTMAGSLVALSRCPSVRMESVVLSRMEAGI